MGDLRVTAGGMLPVAVVNAPPAYRHGLLSALVARGCVAADPDDPLFWAKDQDRCAVLVLVDGRKSDVDLLLRYTSLSNTHVVALLREGSAMSAVATAICCGADGVCPWDSTTEQLAVTITAAASGFVMLPASIATQLVQVGLRSQTDLAWLGPAQRGWLRELAEGCTIAKLARNSGYSERAMHRLLRELYRALGVQNRSDALVFAARQGLLEDEVRDI